MAFLASHVLTVKIRASKDLLLFHVKIFYPITLQVNKIYRSKQAPIEIGINASRQENGHWEITKTEVAQNFTSYFFYKRVSCLTSFIFLCKRAALRQFSKFSTAWQDL